jgi:hypothetical protein
VAVGETALPNEALAGEGFCAKVEEPLIKRAITKMRWWNLFIKCKVNDDGE